ncbi:MAG: Holliday junction resolvase RuvX [Lachnospiraceae bacterium]|nr:Holliday junction resolvase RuvX [Lachnospiraceae bacterium]
MKLIALDYGSKTVGVAQADELGLLASPLETIFRKEEGKLRKTYARIEEICKETGAGGVVVGLPVNMDGSESARAGMAREFASAVERRTGLKVVLWDERLTTVEAEEILREKGIPRQDFKKTIDAVAAAIILQDYLDNGLNRESEKTE